MSNNNQLPMEKRVEIFKSRFAGREDAFNIDKTPYDQVSTDPNIKVKKKEWLNIDKITDKRIPLSDEDIVKHITGQAPIAIFQKLVDDTIKFAVVDFDHPWDYSHVVEVQTFVWKTLGIPCYMAKSSRKGWHLIFFFSAWLDMRFFTSFWPYVVQETMIDGIVLSHTTSSDDKPFLYPEVFPRPASYGDQDPVSLTCGAIKPPMVEPRMALGFNAFHKEFEPQPFCVPDQWNYLANTKQIDPDWFINRVKELNIEVVASAKKRARPAPKVDDDMGGAVLHDREQKPKGNFTKVLKSCPALREAYDFTGKPSHFQRLALGIIAASCKDGHEHILKLCETNPQNWQREETEKHLKYITGRYAPYTCEKLQMMGVCHKGLHPTKGDKKDHCLEPREVDGEKIPPSPYRFAVQRTAKEDVTFDKLKTVVMAGRELIEGAAKRGYRPGTHEYDSAFTKYKEALIDAYHRVNFLKDPQEQATFRTFLDSQDVTKTVLKDVRAEAKKRQRRSAEQEWMNDEHCVNIHGRKYRIKDHHAYVMVKFNEKEGVEEEIQLTNFIVIIEKGKLRMENLANRRFDGAQARTLSGKIKFKGNRTIDFVDIPTTDFESPSLGRLYDRLANLCEPGAFTYEKRPDDIRNCIKEFNRDRRLGDNYRDILSVDDVGWNGDVYLVSNAYVSDDTAHPMAFDEHATVKLSADEHAFIELNTSRWKKLAISSANESKAPAFDVLSSDRLRSLLDHFFKSFLKWHQPEVTYVGAGFALAACIQRFFPQRVRTISPSLFFVGEFEGGKSEVIKALQNFYGPYEQVFNWASVSEVNLLNVVHLFKDMVIGIDDYKKSTTGDDSKVIKFIQVVYDRYGRGVHDVYSNETRESKPAAGLFLMGGEDIFESEPSAATRCIFVDFNKYKRIHEENLEEYMQIQANRKSYSAITANLIQWSLRKAKDNPNMWEEWYQDALNLFGSARQESSNATRIINNVSLAHMGFRALLTMADEQCQSFGVEVSKPLLQQHMINLNKACLGIINDTLRKLQEDKASTRFLRDVVELLVSNPNQFYIEGHGTRPNNNVATRLGWVGERTPDIINLIPDTVVREICRKHNISGQKKIMQTQRTIGFALLNDGYLAKVTEGREPYYKGAFVDPDTKQKSQPNVFAIKKAALFAGEFEPPNPPEDMVERAKEALTKEVAAKKQDQRQVKNYAPGAAQSRASGAESEV